LTLGEAPQQLLKDAEGLQGIARRAFREIDAKHALDPVRRLIEVREAAHV
jgi:hypothetical protein